MDTVQPVDEATVNWIMGIVAILLTAGITAVATKLFGTEHRLTRLETENTHINDHLDRIESKLDKIIDGDPGGPLETIVLRLQQIESRIGQIGQPRRTH